MPLFERGADAAAPKKLRQTLGRVNQLGIHLPFLGGKIGMGDAHAIPNIAGIMGSKRNVTVFGYGFGHGWPPVRNALPTINNRFNNLFIPLFMHDFTYADKR